MPLKVLVVDDEPLARQGLRRLLCDDPEVDTVHEVRNGREAVAFIRAQEPHLVLLDVQMPRMDGFGVVEAVGADEMPPVIFVTAHDQYAVRAFEVSAVDYLLKPVTKERFRKAFSRAKCRLRMAQPEGAGGQMRAMLDAMASPPRPLRRLAVRDREKTLFVSIDEVDWIEALQNYVRVHVGGASHVVHVPISTIEAALDHEQFLRIHRSHIVNVERIKQLWPLSHGQYVVELMSGQRVPSGRTYRDEIRRALMNPF